MGLQTGKIESRSGDRKTWTKKWLKGQSNRKIRRLPVDETISMKHKGYEL